MTYQEVAQT
ncbi:hypothetical protein BIW11_04832 [Tropilaelaps mercedesae]|uniref:Uncharacterized protein n=1 Tax=Tropilaelaps mercedesae TaxID=418985 RepID=A0A1V9X160_9ACAR|nr:hypothetical protein BIW11_04832 [Tropilaelaps mercedesae]